MMSSNLLSTSGLTWATPVVFKAKEYKSASDALQAYITDYEGKQRKYYGKKSKYDKQFMDLFCPKNNSAAISSSRRSTSMDKSSSVKTLVDQVYEKLKKDEAETVQRSLSASMQLMERIEKDKLPSPTRSTILGGRPSTGSVDTDVLLDARPVTHLSNGVGLENTHFHCQNGYKHMETSRKQISSSDIKPDFANYNDSKSSTKYKINGMDSLLNNINQNDVDFSMLYNSHLASESIDDLLMPHKRLPFKSDENTHNSSQLNNSLITQNLSKHDSLRQFRQNSDFDYGNSKTGRANAPIQDSLLRLPEHHRDLRDQTSKTMDDIKGSFKTVTESLRDFNTNIQNSPPRLRKFTQRELSHKNLPQKHTENYLGDSDATNSSIITGHMLKGALPHKQRLTKVSSTPKRVQTKQLRFENNDITKSSVGQGLEIDDLTGIPPHFGQSLSKHAVSLDSSFDMQHVENGQNLATTRKNIVGILKGNSPGKTRRAMSRVSFTTDDLLNSDPTGLMALEETRPRSRSLPRPLFPPTNEPGYREIKTRYTSQEEDVTSGKKQFVSPFNSPNRSQRSSHDLHNPFARKSVDVKSPVNSHSFNMSNVKESKYRLFLQSLMKEIDDSASSVTTLGGNIGITNSNNIGTKEQDTGCGFLERIQNILATEQIPTVAQYLDPEDTHDSLTTEAVLDGDRSWEKRPTFKAPTEVKEVESNRTNTIFDRFMNDCMEEAQAQEGNTISGKSQPGSLEALKNMLFTIQSLSISQDEGNQTPVENSMTGYDEAAILNEADDVDPVLPLDDSISKLLSPETKKLLSNSYTKQPGGPSLATAMEHLTKLKDLVENKPD